jgi:PAS domain S-box-containing protein
VTPQPFLEQLVDGALVVDDRWQVTYASARALELLGPQPLVGQSLPELFPGTSLDELLKQSHATGLAADLEGALQGTARRFRVGLRPGSGGMLVLVSRRTNAPDDETGTPVLLQVLERVASSAPLPQVLDALMRYAESLVRGVRCSILLLDGKGMLRDTAAPSLPAEYRKAVDNLRPALHNGSCGTAVFEKKTVIAGDLSTDENWVNYREIAARFDLRACWSYPLIDQNKQVLGSLAAYSDVPRLPRAVETARLHGVSLLASLAIEKSRDAAATQGLLERYGLVLEATQHVVFDWAVENDDLQWSARLREVLGYEGAAVERRSAWWLSLIHPDERARVQDTLAGAVRRLENTWTEEYRMRHADGRWVWVSSRAIIRYENARPERVVGVMQDVTAQKDIQARLTLTERLASVGTLAAGVAHEINNPLAWITSNVNFAVEELARVPRVAPTELPALLTETRAALEDIRSGAERVALIVKDLKIFSRADDERVTQVDVKKALEAAITMANNELRHRARLVRAFAEVPPIEGNESRLSQVFLNLLINAAQALPEQNASHHEIRVTLRSDELGAVVVEVRDTGAGIPANVLPRIFDPFFTTKPVGQGTGLGLSICHTIISRMGGSIEVESTQGQGTTFRVRLPSSQAEVRSSPSPVPRALPGQPRAKVAVIDDERAVLVAVQRVLGSLHDISGFTSARAALEELPKLAPDLIFCDLMMPELSGIEFFRLLEAQYPELAARVRFITGGAFTTAAREFLDSVPHRVLEKPFTAQGLRAFVSEELAQGPVKGS